MQIAAGIEWATKTYVFKKHATLIASPIAVPQRRDESSRIHLQQRFRFLVRVHFNILIWNALDLERYPDALHKGTVCRSTSLRLATKRRLEMMSRFGGNTPETARI